MPRPSPPKSIPAAEPNHKSLFDYRFFSHLLAKLPGLDRTPAFELEDLLLLLEVKTTFKGFLVVLENFNRIADIIPEICRQPQWRHSAGIIRRAQYVCQTILKHKSKITSSEFKTKPASTQNQTTWGAYEKSPLYATLVFLPEERSKNPAFYQLLAHILIANTVVNRHGAYRFFKKRDKALKEIRKLAEAADLLALFPLELLTPEEYLATIRKIDTKGKLSPLVQFLTQALHLQSGSTSNPEDFPEHSSKDETPQLPGWTATQWPYRKALAVYEEPHSPEDEDEALPPGLVYVFPKANWSAAENRKAAEAAAKARRRDNQLFHFSWDALNQYDLQVLFSHLFLSPATDHEDLKARIQLGLVFLLGMSPARIASIGISEEPIPGEDSYSPEHDSMRLVSIGPALKNVLDPLGTVKACTKQDFIDLPLPDWFVQHLKEYLRSRKPLRPGSLMFPDSPQTIRRACRNILSLLQKKFHTRLTFSRISTHMERRLASLSENDLAGASLTLGKEIYLARTRIHYASYDVYTMQRLCRQAWEEIALEADYPSDYQEPFPEQSAVYLGTPKRPRTDSVQALFCAMAEEIGNNRGRLVSLTDLVAFHNLYVTYTALVIAYSTGYRAVNSPFIKDSMVDPVTGLAVLRDKDSADYYHSRLVWLAKVCRIHLEHYRRHIQKLRRLDDKLPANAKAELGSEDFFFLDAEGRRVAVTVSQLAAIHKQYGFHLPPNVQRHYLKSELQENGCPGEVVELLLGHWHLGQEGWHQESALPPLAFRAVLEKHLPPLLRRIHCVALAGISKLPAASLNLHDPIPRLPNERSRAESRNSTRIDALLANAPPASVWLREIKTETNDPPALKTLELQEKYALLRIRKLLPEAYAGGRDLSISRDEVDVLVKKLMPSPMRPGRYYSRMKFLIDGLERGKQHLNWTVEVPARPVRLTKGRSRLHPRLIPQVQTCRTLEKAFLRDLENPAPQDPALRLGQILVSAVLFGGLHHIEWVAGLFRGLAGGLYQHEGLLWVDLWVDQNSLSLSTQEQWVLQRDASRYRRWLVDRTTRLLIYRWLGHFPEDRNLCAGCSSEEIFSGYLHNLKKKNSPEDRFGRLSLKQFLSAANARATLHLPPFLAAYCENQISSTSLPDPVWLRLLSGQNIPVGGDVKVSRKSSVLPVEEKNSLTTQLQLLRKLRSLVPGEKPMWDQQQDIIAGIQKFLSDHEDTICSILAMLARWAIQLLSPKVYELERRLKNPERPGTVKKYLGAFSMELLTVGGTLDLLELEGDELKGLLKKTVHELRKTQGSIKENEQRLVYNVERLNQFLGYLEAFHGVDGLRLVIQGEAVTVAQGDSVRSNLLTVAEYHRLLHYLGWGQKNLPRPERMSLVAAILLFRAGLRSAEAHGLLLRDLQGGDHLELLVRPNRLRGLKTSSSMRRMPLYALLQEEELKVVQQWHHFRQGEIGALPSSALFTAGPISKDPVPERELFDSIRYGIRHLTGDDTLVLHHLRHSFATWSLLRLTSLETPEHIPPFLRSSEFSLAAKAKLKNDLLQNENTGRKSLYATAALLGHADTETCLHTYVHLCDLLTLQHSNAADSAPALSAAALAQLLGCSIPNAYKIAEKGPESALAKLGSEFEAQLLHPLLRAAFVPPVPKIQRETASNGLPPYDIALHSASSSATRPRSIRLPRKPEELRLVQQMAERVWSLAPREQRRCISLAQFALSRFVLRDRCFEVLEISEAPLILEALATLGVGPHQVEICHHPPRWASALERRNAWRRWQKNLKNYHVLCADKTTTKSKTGCLQILLDEKAIAGNSPHRGNKIANSLMFTFFMISSSLLRF